MAEYGKVFDLLDDACLNIQDVEGTVRPFPQLLQYMNYHENIIIYKIDVNLNHFFGRLQDYTDNIARKVQKEIWTFAVQWEVNESAAEEVVEEDIREVPKGPAKRRKVEGIGEGSRPKARPAQLNLGMAPNAANPQSGPAAVSAPLRSPFQYVPPQVFPSATSQPNSPTTGSIGLPLSPLATSLGGVHLSTSNPIMTPYGPTAQGFQAGPASVGPQLPQFQMGSAPFAQPQVSPFQQGQAPRVPLQVPQFQVTPASPAPPQVPQFQQGQPPRAPLQVPQFQQGLNPGAPPFIPVFATTSSQSFPPAMAHSFSPAATTNPGLFAPSGSSTGAPFPPANSAFGPQLNAAASPSSWNLPMASTLSSAPGLQSFKAEHKHQLDHNLLANEEILRILSDIAQCVDELVPNFIDILYKVIDYYTSTSGQALQYAKYGEIPSLDGFDIPPDPARLGGLPIKPDFAGMEAKYAECERLQYTRPRNFGIQIPQPEIDVDPDARISPLVNVPTDQKKYQFFLAACFNAREKAVQLLLEAGMTMEKISNYQAGQDLHPLLTPGEAMGHGLSRFQVNRPYGKAKNLWDEKLKRAAVQRTEEMINKQIQQEMKALGLDPSKGDDKYAKVGQLVRNQNISSKIRPLPAFIYFPRCCLRNGTDAVLLCHLKHSGEIVISRAVFFTVPFQDLMTTLIRASAVKVVEACAAPHNIHDEHGSHQAVYSKLLEAHAFMTTHRNREDDLTKRWRTGRPPFFPSPLGYKPPEVVASWGRSSVWEGWGVVVAQPIQLTPGERRGAVAGMRNRIFSQAGAMSDFGLGWEVECLETIPIWERERRRREIEAMLEEEGE